MSRFIKFIGFCFITVFCVGQAQAQSVPALYLGTSTGLENPTGLLGVHVEAPLTKKISVGGGVGIGAWGTKTSVDGKYYFTDCTGGWALGAGLSYSNGVKDSYNNGYTFKTSSSNPVKLKLLPVATANASLYKFWKLGRNHKFYLQTGYAIRLNNKSYEVKDAYVLTKDERGLLKSMTPGGFMLAVGFSFKIAN